MPFVFPPIASAAIHLLSGHPEPWRRVLASVGLQAEAASGDAARWQQLVEGGAYLLLEGESEIAGAIGFRPTAGRMRVSSVRDLRRPELSIVWESAADLPVFEVPPNARVFTRDRWSGAPLVAGFRRGSGAVLWTAISPGQRGHERFPYLLHALADLGLRPPYRSRRLWAFFDPSYRLRVDLDYFAGRWNASGISALHVAAWHYYEPDPERDRYLGNLIEACHRNGVLVYAWLELPHVSEKFWHDHPEWREKTALLQDAHLDWRKLMNLADGECFRAAAAGVRGLLGRFDWDGVNLAELYFESLQGHATPSRFTPMNEVVRREFRGEGGFDPLELFDSNSPRHHSGNQKGLRSFLDYRARLAQRILRNWVTEMETLRRVQPDLEVVVTHVDDRLDIRMRDFLGADAAAVLPLLEDHNFTFLIEDPATLWNLGADRYARIAAGYHPLTPHQDRLGVDLNIVERYQDVYPTKQQTGTELFQLVNQASRSFPRVALYFEHSILAPDVAWLSAAAAVVDSYRSDGSRLTLNSPRGAGIPWKGPALVDGLPWPALNEEALWLPAGSHTVEPAAQGPHTRLLDFAGDLVTASAHSDGLSLSYRSSSRAIAIVDRRPRRIELDGAAIEPRVLDSGSRFALLLPRGQHVVDVVTE